MVGNFGTVGRESEFRRFRIEDGPITFSIHSPPDGEKKGLYLHYIEADLKDANFVRIVLDGLKTDVVFQRRLVQLEANYGWGTGRQVVDELLKDPTLYEGEYGSPTEPKLLYAPDTSVGRRQTLGTLLIEASIQVTNALIVAESAQLESHLHDLILPPHLAPRIGHYVRFSACLRCVAAWPSDHEVCPPRRSAFALEDEGPLRVPDIGQRCI